MNKQSYRETILLLLDGCYLMSRKSLSSIQEMILYKPVQNPLVKIDAAIMRQLTKMNILKKLENNSYVISKQELRSLDGRTLEKKLYKLHLKSKKNGNKQTA